MTLLITLTVADIDTGPFNLYSNVNNYDPAFAELIEKSVLLAGYTSTVVPDGTTSIEVKSVNELCNNFILLTVDATTSTTTSTSTSTSTTTSTSSTTTTTTTSCSICSVPDVTIGTQIWTGCNLDVTTYADIAQTPIPQVTDPTEWANLTTGAWCYMNNDPAFGCIYGKLYNWYAVTDPRGLAPAGYHIPSDAEWGTLIANLGGVSVAGGKMKSTGTIQAGTGLWDDPNAAATNESGFTGLPGDGRSYNGAFNFTATDGYFWSNTTANVPDPEPKAWSYYLRDYDGAATRSTYNKTGGFSVRLIKD